MSYPSASTPNPSVHYAEPFPANQLAFAASELEAIGQNLLGGFIRQVVLGFLGAVTGNTLPAFLSQLSAFSNSLQSDISGATAAINSMISGVGGTVASDVSTAINTAKSDATSAVSELDALISGVGGTVISDVVAVLQRVQGTLDAIANALGQTGTGHTVSQVQSYLESIPNTNVLGTLGPNTISDALGAAVDAMYQGLASDASAVGNSLAALTGVSNQLASFLGFVPGNTSAPPENSIAAITQTNNTNIANRASTKPVYAGVDQSADPVFNFSQLQGSSVPTINVTNSQSVIGMIGTPDAGIKESVEWYGGGTTNIDALYINVYEVSVSTGVMTWLWTSPNLIVSPGVNNAMSWNYADISPAASYITTAQGNYYAVEMQVIGTGTYTIAGIQHMAAAHPTAIPGALGATRTQVAAPLLTNVGAGGGSNYHGTATNPWTHTFGPNDTLLVVAANCWGVHESMTFTVGGVNIPAIPGLPGEQYYTDPGVQASAGDVYALFIPPSMQGTTQHITAAESGVTGWAAQSFSFSGAYGLGSGTITAGSTTGMSQSVSAAANELVFQAFFTTALPAAITGYNQTQQYTYGAADKGSLNFLVGTAPGAPTVNFSATCPFTSYYYGQAWLSVAIPIIGPPISGIVTPNAIGTPYTKNTATAANTNFSGNIAINPGAGDGVLVAVAISTPSETAYTGQVEALYNGTTAMTPLGEIPLDGATYGILLLYGLLDAPGGAATINVQGNATVAIESVIANAVSYSNAGSFGTAVTGYGSSSPSSGAITTAVPGALIANVFAAENASGGASIAGYSGTQHYSGTVEQGSTYGLALVMGDTAVHSVGASATITATSSNVWGSVSVPVFANPVTPPTIANPANPSSVASYSTNVPWFALCGSAGVTQFSPVLTGYTTAGSYVYEIPSWANHFDIIVAGAGGGGSGSLFATAGNGGSAGAWNAVTLTRAQMTDNGTVAAASVTVGAGGNGAPGSGYNGVAGQASSVGITGYGTVSAAAGVGGTGASGAYNGAGPGDETFGGNTYYGGATQTVPGSPGNSPGGAGAGGNNSGGGAGAPGAVFILAYQ
ncbi:MAG: hypothetical protein RBS21_00400 [Corynebacterium sp.]|jgi:hypothetical protein|nr:hypothetical protein [Corynebacterium sp.]